MSQVFKKEDKINNNNKNKTTTIKKQKTPTKPHQTTPPPPKYTHAKKKQKQNAIFSFIWQKPRWWWCVASLTRGSLVLDTGSTGARNDYFPLVHTTLGGEVVSTPHALDASFVLSGGKLQALVYDILPSTTAVFSYAIVSRKLSANEQFFVGTQTEVSLLQTTQIRSDVCFIIDHVAYASSNKTKIVWIETELLFYPGWMGLVFMCVLGR